MNYMPKRPAPQILSIKEDIALRFGNFPMIGLCS